MQKSMTLSYEVGNNLYLNITNQCPCRCVFCIRKNDDGAYGSDSLWLEHEPTMLEMQEDLKKRDLTKYQELVFCGYGEPLMRLKFACELASYLKNNYPDICLRLNTNGLADIYNPKEALADNSDSATKISAVFDKVSVSLNAGCSEIYQQVTNPKNSPENAFATMLHFAETCKHQGVDTCFTVVDVISESEIAKAQKIADKLQIPLSVRKYIS
ncbi:MAG: TatD family nuclease-associated radical SAM protein [Oscillospiraceae bacterium]|nr:TatD family nuclease-associated radical SAM protein [Oscillospiraceae bacterium]